MDRIFWASADEITNSPVVERQVADILRRGCMTERAGQLSESDWDRTLYAIHDVYADARRRAGLGG